MDEFAWNSVCLCNVPTRVRTICLLEKGVVKLYRNSKWVHLCTKVDNSFSSNFSILLSAWNNSFRSQYHFLSLSLTFSFFFFLYLFNFRTHNTLLLLNLKNCQNKVFNNKAVWCITYNFDLSIALTKCFQIRFRWLISTLNQTWACIRVYALIFMTFYWPHDIYPIPSLLFPIFLVRRLHVTNQIDQSFSINWGEKRVFLFYFKKGF